MGGRLLGGIGNGRGGPRGTHPLTPVVVIGEGLERVHLDDLLPQSFSLVDHLFLLSRG